MLTLFFYALYIAIPDSYYNKGWPVLIEHSEAVIFGLDYARWAAVYGVTQSWTRLTWLSSSSSSMNKTQEKHFTCTVSRCHCSPSWLWPRCFLKSKMLISLALVPLKKIATFFWETTGLSTPPNIFWDIIWCKPLKTVVKNPPANAGDIRDVVRSLSQEDPWRRAWQPTPVLLPGESRGQRSPVGYSL